MAKIPKKVGKSVNEKLDQHDQRAVLWNQESSDQGVELLVKIRSVTITFAKSRITKTKAD